jgi:DNA-directed RNA polymerase specialized sigma24 family protein
MMDIPVGTVMSRLSRGRNLLRGKLKKVARSYGLKSVKAEG